MRTAGPASASLHRWREPAVLAIALVSVAAGFGDFSAVASLGDVAKSFGHLARGTTIADQAGLSGTTLGIGLSVLRVASLGGLPLTGLADRFGRRRVMLTCCAVGLGVTAVSAASPSYWSFVAIFALSRPLLGAAASLGQVIASEETDKENRAAAIALVAGGYGLGAGLVAIVHGLFAGALGFRGIFLLALVPLGVLYFLRDGVQESGRFLAERELAEHPLPVLGAVGHRYRRRLGVVAALAFFVALVSGPANSFLFVYGENVLKIKGSALSAMVALAGVTGLGGLFLGRYLADRYGRRVSGAATMATVACVSMLTYSGGRPALFIGYLLSVGAAATFAPAAGALANELFPTSVRASVSGWLIAASVAGGTIGLLLVGWLADLSGHFSLAAAIVFAPALPAVALFLALPETKGHEPEELWTA